MPAPRPWKRPSPLPGPVLTPRLKIRWYAPEDARALHEAVSGDRKALLPWLPWAGREHRSVEESRHVIERFVRSREEGGPEDFVMGIFERAGGGLVGGTGLHRIVPEAHEAEIGYWIRGNRQGEGLATEATAGLVTSALSAWGLRRVRIHCAAANAASARVAEKLGMTLEGRARKYRWVEGIGWDDYLTFGVLGEEWDAGLGRVRG